ncbi:prolipoprotein diacylglyceryl transferase [Tessaracoccus sp. SD287]|uniref:prolipoprotein diacylglyceryl transferase n=1 Tax=Tessaracoccus sp. SD287 TaxID=2782008 RepID=UPI001A96F9F3|nr:prolipoprotein diacylglyceryl transferase [Tessaracoccus sp. SD287]MBO1030187.1 prolipoprotein diacylglyceryl transferase [Tessaracoccus sp. SD287]
MIPLDIPSPSISSFSIGPLTIHFYALCILLGIFVAWSLVRRRFVARGGQSELMETMVVAAVLAGILGARVYHVLTRWQDYFGPGRDPLDALKIWEGGLGIIGGVIFGAGVVLLFCRRHHFSFPTMADVFAPGILLAQGIGRLGNWFNQELFGKPTDLPWGLQIDAAHRPRDLRAYETFHPTFLYEMLWNFGGVGVLLWAERRFRLGNGRVFMLYVAWYGAGRVLMEQLRLDPANLVLGMRINGFIALMLCVLGVLGFALLTKYRPGRVETPFPPVAPDADDAAAADEPVEETTPEGR